MWIFRLICNFARSRKNVIGNVSRNIVPIKNDDKQLLKSRIDGIGRFSLPLNPDLFLTERAKLTRGEAAYQYFAAGFPIITFVTFMFIPLGLTIYSCTRQADSANREITKDRNPQDSVGEDTNNSTKLPRKISAKDLTRFLTTKTPTIILYFKEIEDDVERSLRIRALCLLLVDFSRLFGSDLNIVRMDIDEERNGMSRTLRRELDKFGNLCLQLVIPADPESLVITLSPPISATLLFSNIIRLIKFQEANLKFNEPKKSLEQLDQQIRDMRSCLFKLELNGKGFHKSLLTSCSINEITNKCHSLLLLNSL